MPGSTRPRRSQPSRPSLGLKLVIASLAGRASEVQTLLARGAPVNTKERSGFTALMCATQAGHLEIVRLLLDAGADHSICFGIGGTYTALTYAVIHRHEDILELLLSAGADPNMITPSGLQLPLLAIDTDQPRILELLLDAGACLIGPMTERLSNLGLAAQGNKPEAIKILLDHGASPLDTPDDVRAEPLVVAASMGHTEIVRLLLAWFGDASDPSNFEALQECHKVMWVAAHEGQIEVLNCILDMGIHADGYRDGEFDVFNVLKTHETPLMAAAEKGHLAIVERLIAAGADVNWSRGELNPPLWIAVTKGNTEVARVLLKAGADVHAHARISGDLLGSTPGGFTLLFWACQAGNPEMATLLLDFGADINVRYGGMTAIQYAARFDNRDVVEVLLAHQMAGAALG